MFQDNHLGTLKSPIQERNPDPPARLEIEVPEVEIVETGYVYIYGKYGNMRRDMIGQFGNV